MNISEIKSFVQEHDWRLIVTALGLAVVALLPPSTDDNTILDLCMDQAAAGRIADISQVRAGNVAECYEDMRQDTVSPLFIYPSESEGTQ